VERQHPRTAELHREGGHPVGRKSPEGEGLGVLAPIRSGRNDNAQPVTSAVVSSEVEESQVREAMARCNGNISAAAKLLGVSRPTMYAKLKKYGL
jgi:Transcriptional regulator containing PAS, AAA-type ATPase, and DNA-binding domains